LESRAKSRIRILAVFSALFLLVSLPAAFALAKGPETVAFPQHPADDLAQGGPSDPVINEFVVNHADADTNEYVEIKGDPNTDYSDFWIVEIEGEPPGTGLVDDGTFQLGTTDANGHWVTSYQANAWENATLTLLLVENFTGTVGNDIDQDDDGTIDTTFWTRITDDVAVSDEGSGDLVYSTVVLDPGFDGGVFIPGGASRIPDGTDTDTTGDWVRNDFDGYGIPGFEGTPDPGEASRSSSTARLRAWWPGAS
jgi:hypothetical protein